MQRFGDVCRIGRNVPGEIASVLISAAQIRSCVAELGQSLARLYHHTVALHGQDLLLLTVLKGASCSLATWLERFPCQPNSTG